MSLTPWPHQERFLHETMPMVKERRVLVSSPTGSGKTFMMHELVTAATRAGLRSMMMAPRIELIGQFCEKLDETGFMDYGLITADREAIDLYKPVQVASVDTLTSRAVRRNRLVVPTVDVLLVDEAHLYVTRERIALFELFPHARIIGFSATPYCPDGRGLGALFDRLVTVTTVRELTEQGILVPANYYAPNRPDLERLRVVRGDYERKAVDERMAPLLGDIVAHWMRYAAERRTALFASSTGHSAYCAELFRAQGVTAEHCDSNTPTAERKAKFQRFRTGETQVFCNYDLATYGFDLPALDCVVLANPTKSMVRYRQSIGRGLRSAPGKKDLLVLCHSGAVKEHGFVDEELYLTLEGVRPKARNLARTPKSKKDKAAPRNLTCTSCKYVFAGALTCPMCGFHFETLAKEFYVHEGELIAYKIEHAEEASLIQRSQFFAELKGYAAEKGWKPGWASYAYKEKFGTWPPDEFRAYLPTAPSFATRRYVKYLFLKKIKAQQRRSA